MKIPLVYIADSNVLLTMCVIAGFAGYVIEPSLGQEVLSPYVRDMSFDIIGHSTSKRQ